MNSLLWPSILFPIWLWVNEIFLRFQGSKVIAQCALGVGKPQLGRLGVLTSHSCGEQEPTKREPATAWEAPCQKQSKACREIGPSLFFQLLPWAQRTVGAQSLPQAQSRCSDGLPQTLSPETRSPSPPGETSRILSDSQVTRYFPRAYYVLVLDEACMQQIGAGAQAPAHLHPPQNTGLLASPVWAGPTLAQAPGLCTADFPTLHPHL